MKKFRIALLGIALLFFAFGIYLTVTQGIVNLNRRAFSDDIGEANADGFGGMFGSGSGSSLLSSISANIGSGLETEEVSGGGGGSIR